MIKRLAPDQPGARKLARHYGDSLLCVRYRRSSDGRTRYTTIELIVEQSTVAAPSRRTARDPVRPTAAPAPADRQDEMVMVHIEFDDAPRRRAALALGAVWDPERHRWLMTRRAARALRLSESGG